MSAPPPPGLVIPVPPNIGQIAASQLIGSLLNFCLYGVMAVQVYVYRLSFPNDKPAIKWMVYSIFLVETVMTTLNGYDMYKWFAEGFGNIVAFGAPGISPFYTPFMGGVMALVVQSFFCYRIYIIKRQAWPLCIFIGLVSLLQCAGGMGGGIAALLAVNEVHDQVRTIFVYSWLIGDMVADIFIAGTMSYLLMSASRQQHKQTNDIVKRIVRLTIETNVASTGVAILSLILFFGTPNTTYFICPTMVLAKLYANTLLVTFNNRAFIHQTGGTTAHSSSVNDSYAPRGSRATASRKSLPFSAGLGLDSGTDTFTSTYNGKVTVTQHSMTASDTYDLGRLPDSHKPSHL